MESMHISSHVEKCGRSFLSLIEALEKTLRFAAQTSPEGFKDEFDRFKIWAGNIAAHRKGRRSLEYRLRDAAHLKNEAVRLLTELQESLSHASAIVNGEQMPWDELSGSDTDSDTSSDPGDDELENDTEMKQLKASVKDTVTCLFRLSMAIRDPAPNSQSRSTITVDKSFYQEFDIHHVREKFPQCEDFLAERFGRAISGRRQYLTYREEHHKKLTKNVEKIGFEEPRTEHTTNSTEASALPKEPMQPGKEIMMDDSQETLSQTSYATSVNATLRVPSLPKEAKEQEHFECPLCFMIISVHTAAAWKQHVYRDLHPYCCTFKQCTTADRLYDSRHAWFNHEMEAHRAVWQCISGCEEIFKSDDDLSVHVQNAHPEIAGDGAIEVVKRTAVKTIGLLERVECPVCHKAMTLKMLQRHLGQHQEQLALFALPPNLEATEEEEDLDDYLSDGSVSPAHDESSSNLDLEGLEAQLSFLTSHTSKLDQALADLLDDTTNSKKAEINRIVSLLPHVRNIEDRAGAAIQSVKLGQETNAGGRPPGDVLIQLQSYIDSAGTIHSSLMATIPMGISPAMDSLISDFWVPSQHGEAHLSETSDAVPNEEVHHSELDGTAVSARRCKSCNRSETPKWRPGPNGADTLCNACGLHYKKLTTKAKRAAERKENETELEKRSIGSEERERSKFSTSTTEEAQRLCDMCEIADNRPVWYSHLRDMHFCEGCWDKFVPPKPGRTGPDGLSHQREDLNLPEESRAILAQVADPPIEQPSMLQRESNLQRESEEGRRNEDHGQLEKGSKYGREAEYREVEDEGKKQETEFERFILPSSSVRPSDNDVERELLALMVKRGWTLEEARRNIDGYNPEEKWIMVSQIRLDDFQQQQTERTANLSSDPMTGVPARAEEKGVLETGDPIPTYAKVHRSHLGFETLEHYEVPYEIDRTDPEYIIILREIGDQEIEILFEHTRRLRQHLRQFLGKSTLSSESGLTEEQQDKACHARVTKKESSANKRSLEATDSDDNTDELTAEPEIQIHDKGKRKQETEDLTDAQKGKEEQDDVPTYVKVHKDHLSVETLLFYEIPYDTDRDDPNYLILLRELDERQTEVLFEHSRRVRTRRLLSPRVEVEDSPSLPPLALRRSRSQSLILGSSHRHHDTPPPPLPPYLPGQAHEVQTSEVEKPRSPSPSSPSAPRPIQALPADDHALGEQQEIGKKEAKAWWSDTELKRALEQLKGRLKMEGESGKTADEADDTGAAATRKADEVQQVGERERPGQLDRDGGREDDSREGNAESNMTDRTVTGAEWKALLDQMEILSERVHGREA